MSKNRFSEDLNSLVAELTLRGYKELQDRAKLGISYTYVFASVDGDIATINLRNNGKFELRYRQISPSPKGGNKLEYRVTIECKTHSVHKIMALVFPEFIGEWKEGVDIHHLDCNHLNNRATNLICLTKDVHNKLHSLLDNANDIDDMLSRIHTYLFQCTIEDEEITVEGLEELIYG